MDDLSGREMLLVGVAVGLLLGAVVVPAVGDALDARTDDGEPGFTSVTAAGPSCYDGSVNQGDGWLHVVASGESWSVTSNATVVHPPGTEIEVDVRQRSQRRYEIAISAVEATDDRARTAADCRRATRLELATGLPEPRFEVTANGRTVRTVDQTATGPRLYGLSNPIQIEE